MGIAIAAAVNCALSSPVSALARAHPPRGNAQTSVSISDHRPPFKLRPSRSFAFNRRARRIEVAGVSLVSFLLFVWESGELCASQPRNGPRLSLRALNDTDNNRFNLFHSIFFHLLKILFVEKGNYSIYIYMCVYETVLKQNSTQCALT